MKIRSGFVSNSSSSSFIIFGKKINSREELLKAKDPYALGEYLGEGQDFFPLTKEIINIMAEDFEYPIYDVYFSFEDDCELSLDELSKKIPNSKEKFQILNIDADYHSTSSVNDFKDNYPEYAIEESDKVKDMIEE